MKKLMLAGAVLALTAGMGMAENLRMGTEGAYPPYNFVNDKGQLDGFEIELGNALCEKIDAQCTWVKNDWDSIIPNLVASNYDTIMAGMNITDERKKSIAFSEAYTPPPPSAYLAKTADADINGTVSAQTNTIQAAHVAETGATLVEFATGEETIAAVRNGEADAVFADKDFLAPFMKDSNGELVWVTGQDNVSLGEGIGIGMRQSDTELKARFDKAIEEMKADGSLDALIGKWFGPEAKTFAAEAKAAAAAPAATPAAAPAAAASAAAAPAADAAAAPAAPAAAPAADAAAPAPAAPASN
ncbi:amino acid ABC transporter substrate-binding protein, PAAT family [Paracoccus sanguinis]|uniref:Amino acid ABC transporter substrate-binding protein, PAAT family n=1 Tax=Paracoccus sanguinis TaxID=1545044 RepID=A0A1H2QSD4_9RHOB|nr:amino acid ABC transporter substrate-binding protein, PAAT family [Paracoccus sanguinis]